MAGVEGAYEMEDEWSTATGGMERRIERGIRGTGT